MNSTAKKTTLWTPANVVTVIRILGVPLLVILMVAPWWTLCGNPSDALAVKPWVCLGLFILLSATDGVDGYLARSRNEVTNFGKFMDPLADKLLVIAVFLVMTETGDLPAWVSLIVLFREFIISGLRMMAATKGMVIAASWYGKAKTVSQIIAISLFMAKDGLAAVLGDWAGAEPLFILCWVALIISLILTILSMVDYLVKAKGVFEDDEPAVVPVIADEDSDIDLPTDEVINQLAEETLAAARAKGITLGTAESLTGGLISGALTAIPGSSDTFLGAVASYALSVKSSVLKVDEQILDTAGAVEESVAVQMAQGATKVISCTCAVAVTGIAGPGGEEPGKPVGTVWMAAVLGEDTKTRKCVFSGSRADVRKKTVYCALHLMKSLI